MNFLVDLYRLRSRVSAIADAAGLRTSLISRLLFGALLGVVPLAVSMLMSPTHRSPYLLAYPAVILSAWLWGVAGSLACAAVAGAAIEHFIFATRQINLAPTPTGWMAREIIFLSGSVLAGFLTRQAALRQERIATMALQQQLARMEAERSATEARERARELSLENEARAQMALDGANAGFWEWDIELNVSKWSNGFYRLHNLDIGGPANYSIWRQQVHPEDVDEVEAEVLKAVADVGAFSVEYRVRPSEGEVRWVMCGGTAIPGLDGKASLMRGYCGDITRRKLADIALIRSEKLALAGRLSAAIAHEISNPLDAAMNLLYLAQETSQAETKTGFIKQSIEQLGRIALISQQTLSFSRTANRPSICNVAEIVERTLDLLRPKLQLGKIEISSEICNDISFSCSSGEIQQILTNLINNAADAMSDGGRLRIRITASRDWKTRTESGVRITISDNGTGMSRDTLHNIFQPFFTTKENTGTGLGMWVVDELVQKHRGQLSVSSSQEPSHHGTTISMFFPFANENFVEAHSRHNHQRL